MSDQEGAVAPVEPVATATPTPDATAAPEGGSPEGGDKPAQAPRTYTEEELQKALQKRLGVESRRQRRVIEAEVRAAHAERLLQERDSKPADRAEAQGEPKQDDFNTYEDWLDARADWRAEQRAKKQRDTEQQQEAKRKATERWNRIREGLLDPLEDKFGEEAVAELQKTDLTDTMLDAVLESEVGVDLGHFLLSNPKEAARIAKLPQTVQVRELAKIETKLSSAPAPSKAPEPITPTGASASPSKSRKDMSDEEWMRDRERELKEKRAH